MSPSVQTKRLSDLIVETGLAQSSGEARRLVDQGAVRVNDEKLEKNIPATSLNAGDIIRVGRRRIVKLE